MANINSPRDGSYIPAILVKDTISLKAIAASGILAGTTEGVAVAIIDGSGNQITSFGGGTQYVDAATAPTHPTGTGIIFNNGGTFNFVSVAQPLPITGSLTITNPSTGAAVPATANYIAGNKAGNLTGILFGSQTSANSIAVVLASDQASIPVTLTSTTITGTVAATQSGTWTVGLSAAQTLATVTTVSTVTAVTAITNALPSGTNLLGKVGIDQTTPGTTNAIANVPSTITGWSFNYQSALAATKAQIKGTAGAFGGYVNLYNPNTAVTFIQVFNKASASVTVGSTAPDFVITLPGLATASGTGTDRNLEITCGILMGTGITVAATTTATGSSAPANAVVGTFLFI